MCAFAVPVSANIFAAALWELLTGSNTSLSAAMMAISSVAFLVTLGWLWLERHRILDARIVAEPQVQARRVLVTGLSKLTDAQFGLAGTLLERVRSESIPLSELAAAPALLAQRFVDETPRLPWFQNLRAIWSHQARLERLVVILSPQSGEQFAKFRELIERSIDCEPAFVGREIEIVPADQAVSFSDSGAVHDALTRALKQARGLPAPTAAGQRSHRFRRNALRYRERDITIDVTPGTKPFSIAAVVSTLGPDGPFLYVGNDGKPEMFNASLRLGSGLIGN